MDRHKELQLEAIEAKRYMQDVDERYDDMGRCGAVCWGVAGLFFMLACIGGAIWWN